MTAISDRGGLTLTRRGPIADTIGVVVACVLVVAVLSVGPVHATLQVDAAFRVLTLAAAAAGAAAAILAGLAARLTGDPRPSWIAAALVLYCLIVLPWSTVAAVELDVVHRASRLVAYLGALVLLLLAIRPPRVLRAWGGWALLLATGLLALVVLGLPVSPVMRWLVEGPVLTVAVLCGWTAAAAVFVADGLRRRCRPRIRLGLGLVVLAVGQLYRVAADATTPSSNVAFGGLRLVGLVIVLVALAQLALLAVRSVESAQWRQQEELTTAALHMSRAQEAAAERDHELRNGLAGLAGITHLLSDDTGSPQHERLKHAVLAELGRLHALLDGGLPDGLPDVDYAVEPVLAGLVALRTGSPVTLSVEPDLRLQGDPAVLAQIVTNLLVNCARHAPGADVSVTARSGDGVVLIEVRDTGPGLPPDGAREVQVAGSGLGLPISRRLAATQGGRLRLRTVTNPRGCLATLSLPARPMDITPIPVTDGNLPSVFH
jgi:two-component system OmpR family sensor kinase